MSERPKRHLRHVRQRKTGFRDRRISSDLRIETGRPSVRPVRSFRNRNSSSVQDVDGVPELDETIRSVFFQSAFQQL